LPRFPEDDPAAADVEYEPTPPDAEFREPFQPALPSVGGELQVQLTLLSRPIPGREPQRWLEALVCNISAAAIEVRDPLQLFGEHFAIAVFNAEGQHVGSLLCASLQHEYERGGDPLGRLRLPPGGLVGRRHYLPQTLSVVPSHRNPFAHVASLKESPAQPLPAGTYYLQALFGGGTLPGLHPETRLLARSNVVEVVSQPPP